MPVNIRGVTLVLGFAALLVVMDGSATTAALASIRADLGGPSPQSRKPCCWARLGDLPTPSAGDRRCWAADSSVVGPLVAGVIATTGSHPAAFGIGAAITLTAATVALRMPPGVPGRGSALPRQR